MEPTDVSHWLGAAPGANGLPLQAWQLAGGALTLLLSNCMPTGKNREEKLCLHTLAVRLDLLEWDQFHIWHSWGAWMA